MFLPAWIILFNDLLLVYHLSEIHGGYGIVNNYKYSKEDQDYTVKQSKENKTVQE